jgi:hypothetical protein
MMTFLEFLCRKLIGLPHGRNGDSPTWPCPQCNHRNWHVRPPKPGLKDRFSCWRCAWWGDEADLMKQFYPSEDYSDRMRHLAALRAEWEQASPAMVAPDSSLPGTGSGAASHCLRCRMSDRRYDPRADELAPAADSAMNDLFACVVAAVPDERDQMALLKHISGALKISARHAVHPLALAARCDLLGWTRTRDVDHVAACSDPKHCDDAPCRMASGLAPLTPQEVRSGKYGVDGHRQPRVVPGKSRPPPAKRWPRGAGANDSAEFKGNRPRT